MNMEGKQMIQYMSEGDRASNRTECYKNYDSSGEISYVDLQSTQLEIVEGSHHIEHAEGEFII